MDSNTDYKYLNNIDSPADLRKVSVDNLPAVCKEIRHFIVDSLSQTPGHFASSMGAVEIAVALHFVFNTPYDQILWDVGHQAYAHKIITGRRDAFSTNRKLGGISGFPNPAESEYDAFIAGHASNSISAALGMAMASAIKKEPRRNIVAVIGDASISGGLAFEGLNNASSCKNNMLIVLNDNDMAIDHNVGALNEYMTHINTSKGYNDIRYKLYNLLKRHNIIDDTKKSRIMRFNNSLKSLLADQQNIFEGLNIRYFGPFDGHDIEGLVKVLNDIKDMEGPRILHLRTRKGKGYIPAEKDPTTWHAPGRFDPESGEIIESSKPVGSPIKYQDVFGHTLVELAENNEKVVGITAAMSTGTSLTYMINRFPERTFDVGISEEHAVTFSAGLAKAGLRPYCCIYSTFLQRAFDQIIHDVALQKLPVVFCIDRGGLVGEDGATHQGAFDLSYMRLIPNMIVSAPINEHMLRNLLYTSQYVTDRPMSIRYPRGNGLIGDWRNKMSKVTIGKGNLVSEGSDSVILSIGTIGNTVIEAVNSLKNDGITVCHYDMTFLKPIDEDILDTACNRFHTIITAEEGALNGGLYNAVMDWCNRHGKSCRVIGLGLPDSFVPHATVKQQYEMCGIDLENIIKTVKSTLDK